MSEKMISVYYIGRKAVKTDNVLHNKHRRWPGFGSCVDVPEDEANTYFLYPKVWVPKDVYQKAKEQAHIEAQQLAALQQEPDDEGDDGGEPADTGDNGGGKTVAGGDPGTDDRMTAIKAAVLSLKPGTEDFTKEGSPRVNRVVEQLGTNVSAEEMDEAISALRADGKLPSKADAAPKAPVKASAKAKAN